MCCENPTEFYQRKDVKSGIRKQCKSCRNDKVKLHFRNNENARLANLWRTKLRNYIEGQGHIPTLYRVFGLSPYELKKHIESFFTPEMNWNNRRDWHVDHIEPCYKFNLTNQDQLKECFHYSNIRVISARENQARAKK